MALEDSILDKAVDILHERNFKVRAQLHRDWRRKKPFRAAQEITPDELLYSYNQMSEDSMFRYMAKYGPDAMNEFIREMETMKRRRGINA